MFSHCMRTGPFLFARKVGARKKFDFISCIHGQAFTQKPAVREFCFDRNWAEHIFPSSPLQVGNYTILFLRLENPFLGTGK